MSEQEEFKAWLLFVFWSLTWALLGGATVVGIQGVSSKNEPAIQHCQCTCKAQYQEPLKTQASRMSTERDF